VNNTVTAALRALTADTETILTGRLRPIGITVPQMEFLTILAADPTHSGSSAAKAAHVSPQTGTTVLHNLAARRLITVKHVRGTGRRNTIALTAAGRRTLAQAREAVADVEGRLKALLGTEAVAKIADTTSALQPHLPPRGWQPKTTARVPLPQRSNTDADKASLLHRQCRDWAQALGAGTVPGHVALQFGTQAQIDQLIAAGTWKPDGNDYRIGD
jgi:DNA-binding MarR family transcriptional regulator